jgi:hypothetical protein
MENITAALKLLFLSDSVPVFFILEKSLQIGKLFHFYAL